MPIPYLRFLVPCILLSVNFCPVAYCDFVTNDAREREFADFVLTRLFTNYVDALYLAPSQARKKEVLIEYVATLFATWNYAESNPSSRIGLDSIKCYFRAFRNHAEKLHLTGDIPWDDPLSIRYVADADKDAFMESLYGEEYYKHLVKAMSDRAVYSAAIERFRIFTRESGDLVPSFKKQKGSEKAERVRRHEKLTQS